jgi:hypothetical protein
MAYERHGGKVTCFLTTGYTAILDIMEEIKIPNIPVTPHNLAMSIKCSSHHNYQKWKFSKMSKYHSDKKTPFLSYISDQPLNTNSISKQAILVSDTSRTITEPDASQLELSNHIIILKTNFIKYVTNNKQLLDDVHIDLFSKIMSTSSQATEITKIICTYYNDNI